MSTQRETSQGHRDVTVMTQNLYFGAPLENLFVVEDLLDALIQVDVLWQGVLFTDFNERAEALAQEIGDAHPDLIGLQEAALWRIQSPGDFGMGNPAPATTVVFDFVQILLDELEERDTPYKVVVSMDQLDAELPSFSGDDIRLTDRDVILARSDLTPGHLQILGSSSGQFDNLVQVPIGDTGLSVTLFHGWVAADVKVRGKAFRFVSAHLEDVPFVGIQELQAMELLAGPVGVEQPIILVADLNSDAIGMGTNSYEILLAGGLVDAWTVQNPMDPGATWGHDADLRNPVPPLTQRIDFVLYAGSFQAVDAFTVGEELEDRTDMGWWPSDHAGVVATLRIEGRFMR